MMASCGSIILPVVLLAAAFCPAASAVTVTNTNDSGPGSLRDAIEVSASGDTIDFDLKGCPCTILLSSGQIVIEKDLTIAGPGSGDLTISGNNFSRVFLVQATSQPAQIAVRLENFRILGGRTAGLGGGVYSANADLTLRNVSLVGNTADMSGGGVYASGGTVRIDAGRFADNQSIGGSGGGIAVENGTLLEVRGSTFSRNFGPASGGGIFAAGGSSTTIVGSTFDHNTTEGFGGGILNTNSSMTVSNSTISANSSLGRSGSGGGIANLADGGFQAAVNITGSTLTGNRHERVGDGAGSGILNLGNASGNATVNLRNTIVAGNMPGQPDVGSPAKIGSVVSSGYNLIGIAGSITAFNQPGDQAGTAASPIDPGLEALALNGGVTPTHALKLTSPALDRGNSFGLAVDQRGVARPNDNPDVPNADGGDGSDIGAVEIAFPVFGTASIGGRVMTEGGAPLRRGYVTLTDATGRVVYVSINPFGFYRFLDAPLGRNVTLTIQSKLYTSSPRTIFVAEPLSDLGLVAQQIIDPPTKN